MTSAPRLLAWLLLAASTVCCAASAPTAETPISGEAWRDAHRELEELRDTFAPTAGTMRVAVRFTMASEDLHVRARGALARRPPEELRMILIGPGGMTAFDLLVRGDAWRLEMPARDVVVRHDDEQDHKGLPVAFLRWWLLRPLAGRLLSVADTASGRVFVLREDGATIRVHRDEDGLVMNRRSPSGQERMSVSGPGCVTAIYEHVESKVRATVQCEAEVGRVKEEMFRAD